MVEHILFPLHKVIKLPSGKLIKLSDQRVLMLKILAEADGALVHKNDFYQAVWGTDYVENDTYAEAFKKLRNELNWKADQELVNERAKGYRLNIPIRIEQHSPTDVLLGNKTNRLSKTHKLSLLSFSMLISLLLVFGLYGNKETFVDFEAKPLTYLKGKEFKPALSPDGNYLAFTHASDKALDYRVKVKSISPQRFVEIDFNGFSSSPTWGKSGKKLFFNSFYDGQCYIRVVTLTPRLEFSSPEKVVSCGSEPIESPLSIGAQGEWIYFSYKQNQHAPYVLKRFHIPTEKEQTLSLPIEEGYGDYSSTLSPDGTKLAVLSYDAGAIGQLSVIDVNDNSRNKILSFSHIIYNVTWSTDNSKLYFIDDKNQIASINIKTLKTDKLIKLNKLARSIEATSLNSFLIGYEGTLKSDLFKLNETSSKPEGLIESAFNDYLITPIDNYNNSFLFVSNRTGSTEIWLSQNGTLSQLTNLASRENIKELQTSPTGDNMIFVMGDKLLTVDLNNPREVRRLQTLDSFNNIEWGCNNSSIFASSKVNNIWSLFEINVTSDNSVLVKQGITGLKVNCATRKGWATYENQKGLFEFDLATSSKTGRTILEDRYLGHSIEWDTDFNNVYFLTSDGINQFSLNSNEQTYHSIYAGDIFQMEVNNGHINFTQRLLTDSYIAEIKIKK